MMHKLLNLNSVSRYLVFAVIISMICGSAGFPVQRSLADDPATPIAVTTETTVPAFTPTDTPTVSPTPIIAPSPTPNPVQAPVLRVNGHSGSYLTLPLGMPVTVSVTQLAAGANLRLDAKFKGCPGYLNESV